MLTGLLEMYFCTDKQMWIQDAGVRDRNAKEFCEPAGECSVAVSCQVVRCCERAGQEENIAIITW